MNGSLSDILIEVLAKKRKEIATGQIQKHLGSDTHAFANYMGSLGEILGLPGTKNIIEHLSSSLDQPLFLHHFFEEYTVDLIIDTIQEQVKKSNTLRMKVIDWVKDQLGDWKKIDYQKKAPEIIEKITKVIHEKNESVSEEIKYFKALVLYLNEKNITFPQWNEDFWEELFAHEEARNWAIVTFGNNQMQRMQAVNKLKKFLEPV